MKTEAKEAKQPTGREKATEASQQEKKAAEGEQAAEAKEAPKEEYKEPKIIGLMGRLSNSYNERTQAISDKYKAKNPEKHAKFASLY